MRYVESINAALHRILMRPESVLFMGEDILDPYGGAFKVSQGLSSEFPKRVIGTPISEAAIAGIATGAALRGVPVIMEIMFGDFITLIFDQVLNHMTKYPLMYDVAARVPVVVRTPMGGRRGYGPTHSQCLEKHFAGIPNLNILAPSELHDPGASLERAHSLLSPVLFVEGKTLYPKVLQSEDDFAPTDWRLERRPTLKGPGTTVRLTNTAGHAADITIVSYGSTFEIIRAAAEELLVEDEVTTTVFMIENISIPDTEYVAESAVKGRGVVIVEEGCRSFGIGAEIAATLYENSRTMRKVPVIRLGAADTIIPSARQVEDKVLPSSADIVRSARKLMQGSAV